MKDTLIGRTLDDGERKSACANCPAAAIRRWLTLGSACAAILFWLKTYVGFVVVDGDSMLPTFRSGDFLLIEKRDPGADDLTRGSVVVARFRSEFLVKRIVGLPGETVEVVEGNVRINGAAIPETYAMQHGTLNVRPGDLFPNRLALLGDNRTGTDCQLFYAVVPREMVVGKVVCGIRWRRSDRHIWRDDRT